MFSETSGMKKEIFTHAVNFKYCMATIWFSLAKAYICVAYFRKRASVRWLVWGLFLPSVFYCDLHCWCDFLSTVKMLMVREWCLWYFVWNDRFSNTYTYRQRYINLSCILICFLSSQWLWFYVPLKMYFYFK